MKKVYRKPAVEVEIFTLCEGIASCEKKVTYDPEGCGMFDPEPPIKRQNALHPSYAAQAVPFSDLGQCGCYNTAPADSGWFSS